MFSVNSTAQSMTLPIDSNPEVAPNWSDFHFVPENHL